MTAPKEQGPDTSNVRAGAKSKSDMTLTTRKDTTRMIPSAIRHPEHGRIHRVTRPTGARIALITYMDAPSRTWRTERRTIRRRQINWPRILMGIGLFVFVAVVTAIAAVAFAYTPLPLTLLFVVAMALTALSIVTL